MSDELNSVDEALEESGKRLYDSTPGLSKDFSIRMRWIENFKHQALSAIESGPSADKEKIAELEKRANDAEEQARRHRMGADSNYDWCQQAIHDMNIAKKERDELAVLVERKDEVLLLVKDYVSTAISMAKTRGGGHKVADGILIEINNALNSQSGEPK